MINDNAIFYSLWHSDLREIFLTMVSKIFFSVHPHSSPWIHKKLFGPNEQKRFPSKTQGLPFWSTLKSIIEKSRSWRALWKFRARSWIFLINSGSWSWSRKIVLAVGLPVMNKGYLSQIQNTTLEAHHIQNYCLCKVWKGSEDAYEAC